MSRLQQRPVAARRRLCATVVIIVCLGVLRMRGEVRSSLSSSKNLDIVCNRAQDGSYSFSSTPLWIMARKLRGGKVCIPKDVLPELTPRIPPPPDEFVPLIFCLLSLDTIVVVTDSLRFCTHGTHLPSDYRFPFAHVHSTHANSSRTNSRRIYSKEGTGRGACDRSESDEDSDNGRIAYEEAGREQSHKMAREKGRSKTLRKKKGAESLLGALTQRLSALKVHVKRRELQETGLGVLGGFYEDEYDRHVSCCDDGEDDEDNDNNNTRITADCNQNSSLSSSFVEKLNIAGEEDEGGSESVLTIRNMTEGSVFLEFKRGRKAANGTTRPMGGVGFPELKAETVARMQRDIVQSSYKLKLQKDEMLEEEEEGETDGQFGQKHSDEQSEDTEARNKAEEQRRLRRAAEIEYLEADDEFHQGVVGAEEFMALPGINIPSFNPKEAQKKRRRRKRQQESSDFDSFCDSTESSGFPTSSTTVSRTSSWECEICGEYLGAADKVCSFCDERRPAKDLRNMVRLSGLGEGPIHNLDPEIRPHNSTGWRYKKVMWFLGEILDRNFTRKNLEEERADSETIVTKTNVKEGAAGVGYLFVRLAQHPWFEEERDLFLKHAGDLIAYGQEIWAGIGTDEEALREIGTGFWGGYAGRLYVELLYHLERGNAREVESCVAMIASISRFACTELCDQEDWTYGLAPLPALFF
eukprot:jgi/Bigna1/70468/fgenesh1_pg.12_\